MQLSIHLSHRKQTSYVDYVSVVHNPLFFFLTSRVALSEPTDHAENELVDRVCIVDPGVRNLFGLAAGTSTSS